MKFISCQLFTNNSLHHIKLVKNQCKLRKGLGDLFVCFYPQQGNSELVSKSWRGLGFFLSNLYQQKRIKAQFIKCKKQPYKSCHTSSTVRMQSLCFRQIYESKHLELSCLLVHNVSAGLVTTLNPIWVWLSIVFAVRTSCEYTSFMCVVHAVVADVVEWSHTPNIGIAAPYLVGAGVEQVSLGLCGGTSRSVRLAPPLLPTDCCCCTVPVPICKAALQILWSHLGD